eukprot:6055947-Alexandrium_andersonii.AAC.1
MAAFGTPVDQPNINDFLAFLAARKDRFGKPIRELFTEPQQMQGPEQEGWFRLPWAAYDADQLPKHTPGRHSRSWPAAAEWEEAWHGLKLE